jgi:hypothetical protein
VDTSQQLHLTIGLPLRDQAGLTSLLQTLYDSSSPNFHNFQTPQQLADRFGATDQDLQAVADWAAANGLTVAQTHPNRLIIELDGSVADVQKAFNVTINKYQDPVQNRSFYAPDREPTIDLAVPVQTISGLDSCAIATSHVKVPTDEQLAAIRAAQEAVKQMPLSPTSIPAGVTPTPPGPTPNAGSGPGGSYAGCDFRAAYAPGVALTGAGQTVGLLQFDNYYDADITAYKTAFGIPNIPTTRVPITVADPPAPGGGNLEVSLDIEMAMAMAPGLGGIYVYETSSAGNYTAMLSRMQSDNFSKQLSSSWSINFAGNPHAYIAPDPTVENIFQLMAAQGQSFFQASGDFDAWTNSGAVYFPWPMDSINITLVGGTTLSTAGPCGARTGEVVWNWGGGTGSSGGISTYYSTPWWQASTPVGPALGSAVRRNIPDVALTADQIHVRYGNGASANGVGGTSCAAPLWAGFMALVNQQAMNAGRAPIGFLNPAAYTIGNSDSYLSAFNDCTSGNNEWVASPTHFTAVAGYDLCTGWGTPKGQVLVNLLAGDPAPPSLVGNGGFETGAFPPWTASGGSVTTGSYPHAGTYGVSQGPVGSTNVLTQTIDTTPGRTYVLSFWLINFSGGTGIDFKAKWNGGTLIEIADPASSFGWTRYQFSVVAPGPTTTIEFDFRHDPSFWGFDDVGVTPAPQIQDEVANPGFETGTFAGWTQGGNTGSTGIGGPPYNHTGRFGAQFGPVGSLGSISQTIRTVPGQRYILSFWLDNPFGGTGTEFKTIWNGSTLTDQVDAPATGWTDYHYTVTATSTTTALEFDFRQDPAYWGFDDVSVSPIYDYQGITFDDLPPTSGGLVVPNMYGGVMWNNFVYFDGFHYATASGYQVASVSPVNIAFNSGGSPAVISNVVPFNLNSAMLTAAWNDNLQVNAKGYLHGALLYNQTFTLSAVAPTLINFNYRAVDQVVFTSSGGTPHPGYGGSGTHFAIDNVIITTFQGLTFDDLAYPSTSGVIVPNGYGDLEWNNFYYLDGFHYPNPSGYLPGAVSRDSAGFNAFGSPASVVSAVPFNFSSAYLTAAWNDNLNVEAKGYLHGNLVYDQNYTLSAVTPTLINFNYMGVTEVDFIASGGTPHIPYGTNSATHFVIDNITTSYPTPQFDAAYLRSSSGEPWGSTDADTAMNRVFGTNHWQDLRYDSVNPMSLFTPATHFVYMEGSQFNWHDMLAFLNGNRVLIEGWVNNGGYLFVNAGPNEGTGGLIVFDTQIYATNVGPFSFTGTAVNPANPIFNGPFTPVGTSWNGNYFAHATVVGDGSLYPLITGTAGPVLGELWPGLGHVMVGTMTEPVFHSPQPQANNLRANILAYAAGARGTAEAQGTFDDLPGGGAPVPNGYLGVNWNNFIYDNVGSGGYVPGTISSPNTAFNSGGTPANINSPNPFDLHSGYFTAAWNDNLQLHVQGYNRGTLIYDQTYTLQSTMPTLINFDFLGVTEVDFTSSGGVHHAAYGGSGTHFAMDNILISTGDAVASGIDHFIWSAIPSPECMGPLIPVTITAKDGNNNTVTTFNGNVSFNGWSGVTDIDNFDTGVWPHAPWVSVEGGGAASAGFIHDGASGLQDPGWYYRTDVSIGSAGDAVSGWIRPGIGAGRAYLGFAASAGGAWSVVAAPNTSQFIIQHDAPYGTYTDVATGDQVWLPGKWYKVSVVFNSSSSATANLYDSDGITLLNTLNFNGITGAPGGVAIRSFGSFSLDTLQRGNPVLSGVLPAFSGSFVNGVWSGSLQTPLPAASMIITATEGLRGQSGSSNPFAVAPLNLTVTKVAGGVNVCWNTCVGGHYQLQQKSGNILNPWSNVGGVLTAGGAQLCVTVAEPPPPWNFFRVIVVP